MGLSSVGPICKTPENIAFLVAADILPELRLAFSWLQYGCNFCLGCRYAGCSKAYKKGR